VAPGLSSGRFASATEQFTLCESEYWKYPINQPDECSRGSIVLHMHRMSLGIVRFKQRGGEVVEL
jgi:hypothetical protein